MRLLILTNNPKRASFRQRIAVCLDILRENGIDCEVVKLPSGSLARRKLFKRAADFDGVFLHKKCLNFCDAGWLRKYSKKIVYDFDDAIMYDDKHPEKLHRKRQSSFQRTVKLADAVTAGNSYLAEHARKFNTRVKVLPTGLYTKAYRVETKLENDGKIRLVWIGSKSTLRYLAGIKAELEQIGSHFDDVVLRIICDDFFALRNMPVEKCLWSKQTEAVALATSDIGLAPLPDNRFTRGKCGFKVLQYAATGLPIVASPVGVNADYVKHGTVGFLAKEKSQWIDYVGRLIERPDLREIMGLAAREKAANFDIAVVGKQLRGVITNCIVQSGSLCS
ncbi:MAG: glycosyltransferase family 4 protein [Planctomycetota bacterium]